MKKIELDFDRPRALQADGPPERRGLERDEVRLLVSTENGHEHARFHDLPRFLAPGTLLVVNTSATLPASLPAWHAGLGPILANVSTQYGGGLYLVELRKSASEPGPLPVEVGDIFEIAGLPARLIAPHPGLPRLWFVRVETDLRRVMERAGSPIRYGYLEAPYPAIEEYQTLFARDPGSAEMPSAGRPFTRGSWTLFGRMGSPWPASRFMRASPAMRWKRRRSRIRCSTRSRSRYRRRRPRP